MPQRKRTNVDWKNGPGSNSAHARIKFTNSCVKSIIGDFPKQTFGETRSLYYEPLEEKNNSSTRAPKTRRRKEDVVAESSTIIVRKHFHSEFFLHPSISVGCAFCNNVIASQQHIPDTFPQPHSRRRFTPMCSECKAINETTVGYRKGF